MLITSQDIEQRLYAVFPGMHDWLPTDTEYLTVEPHEVQAMMAQHRDEIDPTWIKNLWECEEIAMATVVAIRRTAKDESRRSIRAPRQNLAIGEAYAERLQGQDKKHTVNCFISADGVHLFDMQSGQIWPAAMGSDTIYFVRM